MRGPAGPSILPFLEENKRRKEEEKLKCRGGESHQISKTRTPHFLGGGGSGTTGPEVGLLLFQCGTLSQPHEEHTSTHQKRSAEQPKKKKQVEVTRVQTDTARQPFFLPMPPTQIRWHFHFFFFSILNNAIIFLEYFSSVGRSSIF